MKKIVLLHYRPIEDYPPTKNAIRYLAEDNKLNLTVISTHHRGPREIFEQERVEIIRLEAPKKEQPLPIRLLKYWYYNLQALLLLLRVKPEVILCYESASTWPAFAYLFRLKKPAQLFMHYHEYFSNEEYKKQMWLERYNHPFEKQFLYPKALWISHTNQDRLSFFLDENVTASAEKSTILPNYPPLRWSAIQSKSPAESTEILKLVYVGALAFETTYIREVVEWAKEQPSVTLDIISYNFSKEVESYLIATEKEAASITFRKEGVEYEDLPYILNNYHIGLVLYRDYCLNYKFNAPNKLFEYLACGLQVWYPRELKGCESASGEIGKEWLVGLNFQKLTQIDPFHILANKPKQQPEAYFAERVLSNLKEKMLS